MKSNKNKDTQNAGTTGRDRRKSGEPGGGQGRRDEVGGSGIYPVSEMQGAAPDAKVQPEKSFGQGKRGAEGYEDSGTSEVFFVDGEQVVDDDDRQTRAPQP